MKKILVSPALILVLSVSLWAQSADFPHVSGINAEIRNNLVRLTWADSPQARGPVYIFRSARPFSGTIPANIRPNVVSYGTEFFIDEIDDLENIFYFIAASDTAWRRYDTIIPRVNSISVSLNDSAPAEITSEPLPYIAVASEPIEGLSNLRANLEGEKVTISFNNTNPARNTILFRSAQPVRRSHDLINAAIVQSGAESEFTDYPIPGRSWYYALIYEDEISSPNIRINPGINTTVNPVIVPSEQTAGRTMRPIPLPELTLSEVTGWLFSNQRGLIPLAQDTINMLSNMPLPAREGIELKKPRVFLIDLESPAGGEESALFQIIKDYFETFDWDNARSNLEHFLSLPRSREVEGRARFYLGQTFYFTGDYRRALMEFLAFRPYHEIEANLWIDAVLTAMIN